MSDINMGATLYDFNKQAMRNEPILSDIELAKKLIIINSFIQNGFQYFMLLCHEKRDYTLFNINNITVNGVKAAKDLIECLSNRGDIQAIDLTTNGDALECWIKTNNESVCYYFFPYDEGVIEYV